jgi:hypothetical protein
MAVMELERPVNLLKNSPICSDCERRLALASLIFVIVSGTAVALTESWQL